MVSIFLPSWLLLALDDVTVKCSYFLQLSKWDVSDEYGGNVREVTFRSLCHSPLCPLDTAVTELQHASFSNDKRNLVTKKNRSLQIKFMVLFHPLMQASVLI